MNQRSIHRKCCLWLGCAALLAMAAGANAAVFCSVSSTGFTSVYVPSNPTATVSAANVSVTCNRDNEQGPPNSTVTYALAADNGLNPSGTQNRATWGGSYLNYNVGLNIDCSQQWEGITYISDSFPLAKNSTVTRTYPTVNGCIPAGQAVLPPEGTYTDSVMMSFATGTASGTNNEVFPPGSFPVSIIAPASCTLTTPPATVTFAYTAFSASDVLANSSFGVRCSTNLPYTMTLDATVDVVAGLNYSLTLNTAATGGTNPLTSVGTGISQTFYINGRMAAGQAGACAGASCTESQVRTLMITY